MSPIRDWWASSWFLICLTSKRLSQERAESVRDYLVSQGIERNRLVARGYGETEPVADNGSPAGRERNRRVEFNVLN